MLVDRTELEDEPGIVHIELTPREAEQFRFEIEILEKYASVRGRLLRQVAEDLDAAGIPAAPYPGHSDTWPTVRR